MSRGMVSHAESGIGARTSFLLQLVPSKPPRLLSGSVGEPFRDVLTRQDQSPWLTWSTPVDLYVAP